MSELLQLTHWTWWGIAALLVVLEIFVSGTFFLWMGVSAGILGVLIYVVDVPWQLQIVLFAIFSLTSIFVSRKYFSKAEMPSINTRGQHYIGRIVMVEDAIVNGRGKVRVEDTVWNAQGEDASVGTQVKITGVNGATFQVASI